MSTDTIDEQLVKYLADVHSIEEQALAQLRLAPRIAGSSALAGIFRDHLRETEDHERMIRERLGAHGAGHSSVKDLAGRAGGWGMALFARLNPDTPGKLTAHAFSYEHMELAAYEILRRVAERAGDQQTASVARQIAAQEKAMGERLAGAFDDAVEASLREKSADDVGKELVKYLRDAHAIEAQAIQLLQAGPKIAEMEELATVFREHLDQTREHQRLVDERLSAHDSGPSWIESGLM